MYTSDVLENLFYMASGKFSQQDISSISKEKNN